MVVARFFMCEVVAIFFVVVAIRPSLCIVPRLN